jgi:hypothetical protein
MILAGVLVTQIYKAVRKVMFSKQPYKLSYPKFYYTNLLYNINYS